MNTNTLTKIYRLELREQEITALIRSIENDHRDVSQEEEDALNRVYAALHAYVDL